VESVFECYQISVTVKLLWNRWWNS